MIRYDVGHLGKSWWGSKDLLMRVVEPAAVGLGLVPGSRKRAARLTATGNPSDHWAGSLRAYATDYTFSPKWGGAGLGGRTWTAASAVEDLSRALGLDGWRPDEYQDFIVEANGRRFRVQLLYGAKIGHPTHAHVGIKRVGR